MFGVDSATWEAGRAALAKAVALHIDDPNVSLIDLGFRCGNTLGKPAAPELVVRVHVRRKLKGREFEMFAAHQPHRVIDGSRISFPVEIRQTIFRLHRSLQLEPAEGRTHSRELCGGMRIMNASDSGSGTLGGWVCERESGEDMILSAWHVLASPWHKAGGQILHRPSLPAKSTGEEIATFARHALRADLDAAVARLNDRRAIRNQQLGIGAVRGLSWPVLGAKVIKSGAGSGVTTGTIVGVEGQAMQNFAGIRRLIRHIIQIAPESNGTLSDYGDSGAWWLERDTLEAVALHFAGNQHARLALALDMPAILEALNLELISERGSRPARKTLTHSQPIPEALFETGPNEVEIEIIGEQEWPEVSKAESAFQTPVLEPANPAPRELSITREVWLQRRHDWKAMILNCLLLAIGLTMLGWTQSILKSHRRQMLRVNDLHISALKLRAMTEVDRERRQRIEKVKAIIDYYNPIMPSELKLDLAQGIDEMSRRYRNLEVELIAATITHETGHTWKTQSVSPAGALGLMQVMPGTGQRLATEEGLKWTNARAILFDPLNNIRLGCRYLSSLIAVYGLEGGLAAYNGGEKRADLWLRKGRAPGILPQETAFYVPAVLKLHKKFREMQTP